MDNKKIKILIMLLTILIIGLVSYIVYDKVQKNDEISSIKNETVENKNDKEKTNNENEQDIIENKNNEDLNDNEYDFDYNTEKCKNKYSDYNINNIIYKIKITNPSGAKVYDGTNDTEHKIINTIEYGKELGVIADMADGRKISSYKNFNEIKDDYYFAINLCGNSQYVKYSDVEIIDSSITNYDDFEKTTKFYVYEDEYLYSGPGLSFEKSNEEEKIPKGTILNVDKYIGIGNGHWLYVEHNGKSGWILRAAFHSENYPYNSYKYGSAVSLDDEKGELSLENEENLYKYAFSTDDIISKIPKGTKVSYDYSTVEPGITYYHINYNNYSGWIIVFD